MAIVKTGDDIPVLSYIDEDGKDITCPKCGRKIIVVAIDSDDNKLVCTCDEDE